MKQTLLARGARTVVEVCAQVKKGETAVIVADPHMQSIAQAIANAVYASGAEPVLAMMVTRTQDGEEPPGPVASAMARSNVFFSAVSRSITHTRAVTSAVAEGSRGIMLTGFTESMLAGGGVEADFRQAAPVCKRVAEAMAGSRHIHLTNTAGTDLRLSAEGRRGNALTCIVGPGEFSPCPTVEANVSPVEGSAEGVIVADASVPYIGIGLLEEPVVAKVSGGLIREISGGRQAKLLAADLAAKDDPNVYNIAELGVGLNPRCRFIGEMLEDEGVYGTVHIGIGTNITLGGNVKAACHYDLIMTEPTIVADGKIVLERGEVRV